MKVGQVTSVKRVFDQDDFDRFAALSGDDNPIHVDAEFAARTAFGKTVAHGMLLYGVVCGVLGTRLSGLGTVQLEQELMFPNPTYVGEQVVIRLEITELGPVAGLADLSTVVTKPGGEVGLQGRTLVRLPGDPAAGSGDPFGAKRRTSEFRSSRIVRSGGPTAGSGDPSGAKKTAFKGMEIGQQAKTQRTFTRQNLVEYASLTGDTNPVFTDPEYAARMGFAGVIVPGSLLGGLFSYLLGTRLPGRGTNYLKQRLVFPAPAYPGEELTAKVEIIRLRPEKNLVNLRTVCTNSAGEVVCEGEALVLVRDVQKR